MGLGSYNVKITDIYTQDTNLYPIGFLLKPNDLIGLLLVRKSVSLNNHFW